MAVGAALLFLLVPRARALTAHATRLQALRDWAVASEALPVRSALTSLEIGERSKRASALRAALDETYDDLRTLEAAQDAKPERARQTFDVLDRDADGAVTLDDVLAAATEVLDGVDRERLEARFAEADADASGALDFYEFETYWRSQQRHQDGDLAARPGAGNARDVANYLGRFPLVSASFWTRDDLSERSRRVDAFSGTRARGTRTLKRR